MDVKKDFKKYYPIIGWAIVWVIFLILALVIPGTSHEGYDMIHGQKIPNDAKDGLAGANFTYWGGFIFTNIAFIVVGAVMFLAQRNDKKHINGKISIYVPLLGYFVVAFILNLIFMIVYTKKWVAGVLVPNIILLLLAALIIMFVLRSETHVQEVGENLIAKAKVLENFETQVFTLVERCKDCNAPSEVTKEMDTLLLEVRHSESMSVPEAQPQENLFLEKLVEIDELLDQEPVDGEAILKLIKKARTIWKTRSRVLETNLSRLG